MILTEDIKNSINKNILCWLATSSLDNVPNVSPKEVFTYFEEDCIIIANIASPQSILNIKENSNVCLSLIDILIQKGHQLKGKASLFTKQDQLFNKMETELLKITQGKFPFSTIIKIKVNSLKPIIAPKYILYPETTEKEQIESAKKAYGF